MSHPATAFSAKPATSATQRLLDTDSGSVYILRDRVDMDDFKADLWLAVLVSRHKTRSFEQKLGNEPLVIAEYGKVLLRSGEPITPEMVEPLLETA